MSICSSLKGPGKVRWRACLGASLGVLLLCTSPAQSALRFTDFQLPTNGVASFSLETASSQFYRLDVSTNLDDWLGWRTLQGTGQEQITDTGTPYLESRFYRAEPLEGGGHLTGDHLNTSDGDIIIHPINHASFVMQWKDLMIYNDPVGGSSRYTGLARADLILVSHDHGDHYSSSTLDAVRGANVVIVAPLAVYNRMTTTLRALTVVLSNGQSTNVAGLNVAAVPAYNGNHPQGSGNGYVVTVGERRIYMSGDTGDIPEMRALTDIDVAFVAMNVPFTMSVDQAASAVREFQPRVVYPYHFRNQDGTFADRERFRTLVGTDLGVEVRNRTWY